MKSLENTLVDVGIWNYLELTFLSKLVHKRPRGGGPCIIHDRGVQQSFILQTQKNRRLKYLNTDLFNQTDFKI